MSSPVSATTTSASASSSSTAAPVCSNLYVIPIAEAGCAVSFTDSHKDAMSECCKSADVISYSNDCGLYCAAAGQTIKELQDCLFGESVAYQDVFCNANQTATATNTNPALPPSASASVVSSGDGKDDDQDGNDGDDDDDGDDKPEPTDSGSAAPRLAPGLSVSKAGLTIGALLFSAMAFGAFQI